MIRKQLLLKILELDFILKPIHDLIKQLARVLIFLLGSINSTHIEVLVCVLNGPILDLVHLTLPFGIIFGSDWNLLCLWRTEEALLTSSG